MLIGRSLQLLTTKENKPSTCILGDIHIPALACRRLSTEHLAQVLGSLPIDQLGMDAIWHTLRRSRAAIVFEARLPATRQ